jgi:hypothetical protein
MTKKRSPRKAPAPIAVPIPEPARVMPPLPASSPAAAPPEPTPATPPPAPPTNRVPPEPSAPPAPQRAPGEWPTFKLGESYVCGGRFPVNGPPPTLRRINHDPHQILSGGFDARRLRLGRSRVEESFDRDTHDMYRGQDVKKVCPF